MRVVVCLLDQGQFFSLRLIQSTVNRVCLLELFEGEDEQFRIVLVRERWEGDWGELSRLQPVHSTGIDGNSLLGRDVWTIFQVTVLSLLLGLEVQSSETTQVLPDYRLVDGSTSPNSLSVEMGDRGVVVRLVLDVSTKSAHSHIEVTRDSPQDDVLDGSRHSRDLPRNVGLPTSPSLRQVL